MHHRKGATNEDPISRNSSSDLEPHLQKLVDEGARWLSGVTVEPFAPFLAGRYTVTALKAYHGSANPYVYAISDGSKTILYAHDTDIFKDETWAYLKGSGLHFDLVSLDCTEGFMTSCDGLVLDV